MLVQQTYLVGVDHYLFHFVVIYQFLLSGFYKSQGLFAILCVRSRVADIVVFSCSRWTGIEKFFLSLMTGLLAHAGLQWTFGPVGTPGFLFTAGA
jgi:hypothetical protein